MTNAVDEARQGYGKLITLTAFRDGSIQVEDNGRGCPLDWNPSEKRLNWELGNVQFLAHFDSGIASRQGRRARPAPV